MRRMESGFARDIEHFSSIAALYWPQACTRPTEPEARKPVAGGEAKRNHRIPAKNGQRPQGGGGDSQGPVVGRAWRRREKRGSRCSRPSRGGVANSVYPGVPSRRG